jgi:hypothetical protein
MTIKDPIENQAIDIDANRRLLNRYRYIEQEGLRILAGWLPKTALFELKCEMGRAIWEDAQHVNALYLRLREIQSPAFQVPADKALVRLMSEMLHAPGELALAVAFWRVLKPALQAAYRSHETATFPTSDFPSVHAIDHIVIDEERQVARVGALLERALAGRQDAAAVAGWEAHVRALLRDAGGITGDEPRGDRPAAASPWRRTFEPPVEVARDVRFTNLGSARETKPIAGEEQYDEHTAFEFESYSTEMLAAETVALVMYRLPMMPWEFVLDSARHLYDEVRHCLMGYEWMRLHGLDPFRAPQNVKIFQWRARFQPVEQYCLLTMGNEVNAFPYRHRRVEEHKLHGNRLSEQFVRYDIADETQHVRFGNRWMPELVKAVGEKRPVEKFVADMMAIWQREYRSGNLPINVE